MMVRWQLSWKNPAKMLILLHANLIKNAHAETLFYQVFRHAHIKRQLLWTKELRAG